MSSSLNSCRVLVVDDNAIIRKAVAKIFRRSSYPVTEAANSIEAVDLVCQEHYDLVMSDFDMPVYNGYQLACRVKQRNAASKVVIMTGSITPQITKHIDCGEVDEWLFKPFGLQGISNLMTKLGLPNAFEPLLDQIQAATG